MHKVKASVNGKEHELREGTTVAELLRELGVPQNGCAVAVNERVVQRTVHESTTIVSGDAVEIIHAVAGG
jgi:sulfur carrier protein